MGGRGTTVSSPPNGQQARYSKQPRANFFMERKSVRRGRQSMRESSSQKRGIPSMSEEGAMMGMEGTSRSAVSIVDGKIPMLGETVY